MRWIRTLTNITRLALIAGLPPSSPLVAGRVLPSRQLLARLASARSRSL
jgi:hypothetical protein